MLIYFFHCDFARAVCFAVTTPLRTDTLPNEDDGVQVILSLLITDSTENALMKKKYHNYVVYMESTK